MERIGSMMATTMIFAVALLGVSGCGEASDQSQIQASDAAETPAVFPSPVDGADAKAAAAFTLTDIHSQQHHLADYRGKYVVLEWINHECPFVQKHYNSNNMQSLQKTYRGKEVVWLSICSSAPGKQGHFPSEKWIELTTAKNAEPTAVLLDEDGQVGRAYGAKTTPHMFVIDPAGRVIYDGAIDDNPSAKPDDIVTATNHVATALDAALAGRPVPLSHSAPYGCVVKY